MARGYKERTDVISCPDDGADDCFVIVQKRMGAPFPAGSFKFPDQPGFGAADCRKIKQNADVRRDPQAPGMGDALAVN